MFAHYSEHGFGIGFIFALVLAIWAILNIVKNESKGNFSKAVWIALVLFVPFFGFVLWLFFGPKDKN